MKNKIKLILAASLLSFAAASAQTGGVGVGTTTPDASSALDVTSTTKGFLMPRMTTAQRTAIATPAAGLQVFDTDSSSTWLYDGTVWVQGATSATDNTNDSWVDNAGNTVLSSGNVGIGTNTPNRNLAINSSGSAIMQLFGNIANQHGIEIGSSNSERWFLGAQDNSTTNPQTFRIYGLHSTGTGTALSISTDLNTKLRGSGKAATALDVAGYLTLSNSDATGDVSPVTGMIRYNNGLQYHDGTTWNTVGTSAMGSKWTNDATNTRVALTNLSDGVTARPAGKEFVITDDGKVGIGTTTPSWDLQVTGAVDGDIAAIPAVAGGKPTFRAINYQGKATEMAMFNGVSTFFRYGIPYANLSFLYGGGDNMMIEQTGTTGSIYLSTNGAIRQTILNDGKIGIGTTTPSWDLQVTGAVDGDIAAIPGSLGGKPTIRAINFQGKQTQITTTDGTATVPINGVTSANLSMLYSNADNLLIRQATPTGKIYISTNGVVRQTILDNGNVGVGTMNPVSKLQIDETTGQSNLYLTNSTTGNPYIQFTGGSYFMNASGQFIQNATNSKHLFKNAGQTYVNITNSGLAVNNGDNTATAAVDVNGYVKVGSSDTVADTTPTAGLIRFNSSTNKFQGYDGSAWVDLN